MTSRLDARAHELSRLSFQVQERVSGLDKEIRETARRVKRLRKANAHKDNVHPRGQGGSAAAYEREKLLRKERLLCEEKLHAAKLVRAAPRGPIGS